MGDWKGEARESLNENDRETIRANYNDGEPRKISIAPTLPESVYVGPVGDYIEAIDGTSESPREFWYSSFMAMSAALFCRVEVDWGRNGLRLHIYVLNVGPAGVGKSFPKDETWAMFRDIDPKMTKASIYGSGEGLVDMTATLARPNGGDGPIVRPRLLIDAGEFTGFIAKAAQKGSILTEVILDGYDGKTNWRRPLAGDVKESPYVGFSIVGDGISERLANVLGDTMVASGLVSRLDFYQGQPTGVPVPIVPGSILSEDVDMKVVEPLKATIAGMSTNMFMGWDPDARKWWTDYYKSEVYPRLNDESLAMTVRSVNQRAKVRPIKYAALYARLDGANTIRKRDIEVACTVNDYLMESAASLVADFSDGMNTKLLNHLVERIGKHNGETGRGVRFGDLKSKVLSSSKRDDYDDYRGGLRGFVDMAISNEAVVVLSDGTLWVPGARLPEDQED